MIVKVCGMRDTENIRAVIEAGADWIGMIFWSKSPRHITRVPDIGNGVKRVGVFVDAPEEEIIAAADDYALDIVQLHGSETPESIRSLRQTIASATKRAVLIFKAISIKSASDVSCYKQYEDCIDGFLFDTKCKTVGGSGEHFDWNVLTGYKGSKPFLLSGGIAPDDAQRVLQFAHPMMIGIDINSRFETAPGMKDAQAIKQFIEQIKHNRI